MLAILVMLAALSVTAGGSAPPISCVVRRGLGAARSGRESRLADRTGKCESRCCPRGALWIEGDGGDRPPVSGRTSPAPRVALSCRLVERMTRRQYATILAGMTLPGRDIANAAVVMLFIVPVDEACRPSPGSVQLGEPFERELWPILGGAEQRLDEGIVVADPRAGVGGFDAEPMQTSRARLSPSGWRRCRRAAPGAPA